MKDKHGPVRCNRLNNPGEKELYQLLNTILLILLLVNILIPLCEYSHTPFGEYCRVLLI